MERRLSSSNKICFSEEAVMLYSRSLCGKVRCSYGITRLFHSSGRSPNLEKSEPSKWLAQLSRTLYEKGETALEKSYERTKGLFSAFDELLGITEVQDAQSRVRLAEEEFMETRRKVQEIQDELNVVQERLSDVRQRLDRTPREEESYLGLATDEHKILLEEKKLKSEFESLEARERDHFTLLSAMLRDSHEKERSRAERTKHWSVIGSVGGAALGILGSSLMNYIRLKEIKNSVKGTGEQLMERTDDLQELIKEQDSQLKTQKAELHGSLSTLGEQIEQRLAELSGVLELFMLNQTGDSLFKGLFLGSGAATSKEKSTGGQHLRMTGETESVARFEESLKDLNARVESVLCLVREKCGKIQEGVYEVQGGMKRVEKTLFIQEDEFENQMESVSKTATGLTTSHVSEQENSAENSSSRVEWWSKVNAASSLVCVVISTVALVHELCR